MKEQQETIRIIEAKEFTRLWHSILLSVKKSVCGCEQLPVSVMTLNADQNIVNKVRLVVERVNSDKEFQQAVFEATGQHINLYTTIENEELQIIASTNSNVSL